MTNYVTSKVACELMQISKATLMNWKNSGKVPAKVLSSRKILYDISSVVNQKIDKNRVCVYARVSNTKQKPDLLRQEASLREYSVNRGYTLVDTITDVASGMNENRAGLLKLINLVQEQKIDKIVVSYKDRLTRFGFGYFVTFFAKYGVEIEVVNLTKEEDYQKELTDDFVSILHHFSMKLYSRRKTIVKKCKDDLILAEQEDSLP